MPWTVAARGEPGARARPVRRAAPGGYWQDAVAADLAVGRVALVVAHGNTLRAWCMHPDGLGPREVMGLDIPTGVPLRYDLDRSLRPVHRGGVSLDTALAAAGVAEVAAQRRA